MGGKLLEVKATRADPAVVELLRWSRFLEKIDRRLQVLLILYLLLQVMLEDLRH